MKLHQDAAGALNTVTAYGPGWLEINRQRHEAAVLLTPEGPVRPWPVASFDALTPDDFGSLLADRPELVLLGTGSVQRFPHPRLLGALSAARIGVDAMSTPAACRTYNILMAEGRRVVAALLPA